METFHYQEQPISSPPLSWGEGGGEPSSDTRHQQQPRERGRGGRRGAGVRLSTDPQSMAARERRHRISERFRILKGLVPGGSKMDTVSMLEEAIHYVKFLKSQIWLHQAAMMLPPDETHPPPFPSSGSDAGDPPPPHSVLCYCMPPPPSPLPPFPCSSFHGEG